MTFRFSPSVCLEVAYQQYLPLTNFPLAENWCSNIVLPTESVIDVAPNPKMTDRNSEAAYSPVSRDFFCPPSESQCELLSSLKDQDLTFARTTCCCIGICLEPKTTTMITIPITSSSTDDQSTNTKSEYSRTSTEKQSTRPTIDLSIQTQLTTESTTSNTKIVPTVRTTYSSIEVGITSQESTAENPSSSSTVSDIFRTETTSSVGAPNSVVPTSTTKMLSTSIFPTGSTSPSSASFLSSVESSSMVSSIPSATITSLFTSGVSSSSDSTFSSATPDSTSPELTATISTSASTNSASVITSTALSSSPSTTPSTSISSSDTSTTSDLSGTATTSSTSTSTCTSLAPNPSTTYTQFYTGQHYIEDLDNPGNSNNTQYPAIYTSYPGALGDMCAVALECAAKASTENGGYLSFDLHYLSGNASWVCVQFVDANADGSYFDVRDRDVDVAFGFSAA